MKAVIELNELICSLNFVAIESKNVGKSTEMNLIDLILSG